MALPIALQCYTVRDRMNQDIQATIQRIAEIGYDAVELAGFGGKSPAEVRKMVEDQNLRIVSHHQGLDGLADDKINQTIETTKALGLDILTCPFLPNEMRGVEGYKKTADLFNRIGHQLSEAGIQFTYHNHAFEFERQDDGSRGCDTLINQTDPKLVQFEIDLGWVFIGGEQPLAFAEALAGRAPLLHVKDVAQTDPVAFAEVGTGLMDYTPIVADAEKLGARALIVEQDNNWIDDDPIKSVSISYENLRNIVDKTTA